MSRTIVFPITFAQFPRIWSVALARRIESRESGRRQRYGMKNESDQLEIEGCFGEFAVSEHYGLPWHEINPGGPDVGKSIGVRAIKTADHHLLLHPNDRTPAPIVCVNVGRRYDEKKLYLLGWGLGVDILDGLTLADMVEPQPGRPCWKIPWHRLRPMESFAAYVDEHER